MNVRMGCLAVALAAAAAGCVGTGELPTQVSGRIVGDDEKPIGPGLVMLEEGRVHEGAYRVGGLVGEDGRFHVELPSGGWWGIHIFHDDYQYLPGEFDAGPNKHLIFTSPQIVWGDWLDRTGLPTWPAQPTDPALVLMPWDAETADNPTLSDIELTWESDAVLNIKATAFDPDGDLSRMILAFNSATGDAWKLEEPSAPNEKGWYPNGVYEQTVFRDLEHDEPGVSLWYFVVSDDLCNNSPIYSAVLPPLP